MLFNGYMPPALLLDFARSRRIDPRVSATRAVSGFPTTIDRNGLVVAAANNCGRLVHDPNTYECMGLLVEAQHTNRLLHSEEFDDVVWTKSTVSVAVNAAVAPDGLTTADNLVPGAATTQHFAYQDVSITAGETQTYQVFLKAAGYTKAKLRVGNVAGTSYAEAVYDLTTGQVSGAVMVGTATDITATATFYRRNGYYRCRLTCIIGGGAITVRDSVYVLNSAGSDTFSGDLISGVIAWGAMHLRATNSSGSYIKTTTTQATRSQDSVVLSDLSWFNPIEGTILFDSVVRDISTGDFWCLDDGSINNQMKVWALGATSELRYEVTVGGVLQFSAQVANLIRSEKFRCAMRYQSGAWACCSTLNRDTLGSRLNLPIPTVTQLRIGQEVAGSVALNSAIGSIRAWNYAMPDEELQGLIG